MSKAAPMAFAMCLAAAALEGVLAGRGVKRRLAQLRQPRYSPPFALWLVIGVCYYLICFVVLVRLINSAPSPLRVTALALVVALLIGNAIWNLAFFRLRSVDASAIVLVAYIAVALVLAMILSRVDPFSGWVFLPYLMYVAYAVWWSLSLRKLNRGGPR